MEQKKCSKPAINCLFMNFKFFVTFFFISFLSSYSYSQKKVYFDANFKEVPRESAVYYRLISSSDNNKNLLIDYYLTGVKAQESKFVFGKLEGKYLQYYPTGELKTIGFYEDGLKSGVWKTYDKNGKIIEKGKYLNNVKVGVWKSYYKN